MASKYAVIKNYVRAIMPPWIRDLARGVEYVMWNGLKEDSYMREAEGFDNWQGHENALRQIEAWAEIGFPSVLYVDEQNLEVYDTLPGGEDWREEYEGTLVRFERHEIALAVFGDVVRFGELRFPGSLSL